jgi:hypothetical protein
MKFPVASLYKCMLCAEDDLRYFRANGTVVGLGSVSSRRNRVPLPTTKCIQPKFLRTMAWKMASRGPARGFMMCAESSVPRMVWTAPLLFSLTPL